MKRAAGDSSEQQAAERWLLDQAGQRLGVALSPSTLYLERGSHIEVDGYCADPPTLCEAWARVGKPKSAQKHKVMTDACKLLLARSLLGENAKCCLVFGDEGAAAFFQGTSWMAEYLEQVGIEVLVVSMRGELLDSVVAAQRRQYR